MLVSSQACPKCDPHLASSAGLSSVQQAIPLEPAFTRKKKVPEYSKKVTFLSTYPSSSHIASSDNHKPELYKAGYRRANTSHPTSYQTHYCQPWPGKKHAPLMQAADQLDGGRRSPPPPTKGAGPRHHSPECPLSKSRKGDDKLRRKDGHLAMERRGNGKLPVSRGDEHPTGHAPMDIHEGVKIGRSAAPKCRRPLFVDPLPLPIADDEGDKTNGNGGKKAKVVTSEPKPSDKESKKSRKKIETNGNQGRVLPGYPLKLGRGEEGAKKKTGEGSAGKHRKKRRCYESPLKKLYEEDRARHAQAVGIFETEYRKHYKDWVGEVWRAKEGKKRSVTPPPATYGGPTVTDPSDPRLLKHSPPPALPGHAPETHWLTQYKLHYGEPTNYQYHKGAFRHGRHDNKENMPPVEEPPGGEAEKEGSDFGGHDPAGLSWFDQLIELRRKADQYKWQSERTNFQPHYLVTVRDSVSDDRETSSTPSSSSRARAGSGRGSLSPVPDRRPTADVRRDRSNGDRHNRGKDGRPRVTGGDPLEIQDVESEDELDVPVELGSRKPMTNGKHVKVGPIKWDRTHPPLPSRVVLEDDEDARCTCNVRNAPASIEPNLDDFDGRIPTSELRRKAPFNVRHHLDRTTPYLVSPPKDARAFLTSPSPVREDIIVGGREVDEVPLPRKCSNEVQGAGGRDYPRHISGRTSPFHANCVPGIDRHPQHAVRTRPQTSPVSRKGVGDNKRSQDSRTGKAAGARNRASVTRPGTDSCKVCGSSLKPVVPHPLESGAEKLFGTFPGDKPAKGKDYVVPVTVAAQPCGEYGRMCDKQADHYGIHQSLRSSQRRSQQQLERVRAKLTQASQPSHHTLKPHPSHTHHQRDYEPSSYRSTPENEADHLSLSPLSLSSCSVASDILEKAKNRRDHFWVGQRQPSE